MDEKTVLRAAFSRTSFQEGTGEYNRLPTNAPWNVDLVGSWGATNSQGAIPANQVTSEPGLRRPGLERRMHGRECHFGAGRLLCRRAAACHRSQL